jgi:hypothetical protein
LATITPNARACFISATNGRLVGGFCGRGGKKPYTSSNATSARRRCERRTDLADGRLGQIVQQRAHVRVLTREQTALGQHPTTARARGSWLDLGRARAVAAAS